MTEMKAVRDAKQKLDLQDFAAREDKDTSMEAVGFIDGRKEVGARAAGVACRGGSRGLMMKCVCVCCRTLQHE